MIDLRGSAASVGAAAAIFVASAGSAMAEAQTPTISGDGWAAMGIILGLVAIIAYFINGAITLSKYDDTADEEDEGVGIFEGIEEDDPKPRRRK